MTNSKVDFVFLTSYSKIVLSAEIISSLYLSGMLFIFENKFKINERLKRTNYAKLIRSHN